MTSLSSHIVVTGGAGFVGSHLVEALIARGHRVTVIDDCSTGTLMNLAAVTARPELTVHRCKVSECPELEGILSDAAFVFHLAAAVGVELVLKSCVQTIETNLYETQILLRAAEKAATPLLLTSTSEVYGKSQQPGFAETDDLLIGPPHLSRWSYACSKLMDEFLALAYAREKALPVTIVRLFNTVGPRQTGIYGMVLPRFVAAAKRGTPLRVFGDGTQTRCFCYVGDVVAALQKLQSTPETQGEIFNIGSAEEITIHALAQEVINTLNSSSVIEFVPYREAYAEGFEDMLRRRPVVTKIKKAIGFEPSTPLREIIKRIAASIK